MTLILICMIAVHPFYDGNFSSLNYRSTSIFNNPAGLGLQPGAELIAVYEYHESDPHYIRPGITLRYFGFGWWGMDSINYYEAGLGYKLPGIFSIGYAYQFGDSSHHKAGIIGHPTEQLSLGYYTTIGERFHMFGGISIRPYKDFVTLSADIEYEKTDSIKDYHYGIMVQPLDGLKAHFFANKDLDWKTGLEMSFGQVKVAGAYSHEDERISAGVIISARPYKTFIPDKKKAVTLSLDKSYPEIDYKYFLGVPIRTKAGFTKLLNDLQGVINRDDIKVVVVSIGDYGLGPAQIEELRNLLLRIKSSGKKLIIYADNYWNMLVYELACIGDRVILSPLGSVYIPGLALRKFYLAGTLEKLGIEVDVAAIGEYKSATEILQRENMSAADREQLSDLLDDIYNPTIEAIAEQRGMEPAYVEHLVDSVGFFNSDDALVLGLVDTLLYDTDLDTYIDSTYGSMKVFPLEKMSMLNPIGDPWNENRPKIALVIAEGMIIPGDGDASLFSTQQIGSSKYTRIFESVKNDRSIQAVIVRINSGGGDGLASEKIAHAISQCAQEKPVVVSMGDLAGSGGYYIACNADRILANDRTITGSIGVFSFHLMTTHFYEKLGVTWDYVKRGEHSDAYWGMRRLSEEELQKELAESQWWYEKFTNRVAQGRGMSQALVDSLGKGRIYSGHRAVKLNLVDEIGGFLDALETAKEFALITGDVDIVVYPSGTGFSLLNTDHTQSRFLYLMPSIDIR